MATCEARRRKRWPTNNGFWFMLKGQVVKEDFLHCFFKIISFFVSVCGGLGTQGTPVVFICTRWDKLNIGQAKLRQIELLTLVERIRTVLHTPFILLFSPWQYLKWKNWLGRWRTRKQMTICKLKFRAKKIKKKKFKFRWYLLKLESNSFLFWVEFYISVNILRM